MTSALFFFLGLVAGLVGLYFREKRLAAILAQQRTEHAARLVTLQERDRVLTQRDQQLTQQAAELAKLEKLLTEKSQCFPWLAGAVADLVLLKNNEVADYLTHKRNPARSAALTVKEVGREKRILAEQLKHAHYVLNQYEGLFPFLTQFRETPIEEALLAIRDSYGTAPAEAPEADPVSTYLTAGEYAALTTTERNQRALDRYQQGRKSPYQLGRDYERYVGYLYEQQGYEVSYFGIENGREDLGRDLICRRGGHLEVVQCKYWSQHKLIHEKHLNQLFGTTVKLYLDTMAAQPAGPQLHLFPQLLAAGHLTAVFYTSTELSATAHQFAQALGIRVHEQVKLGSYPLIKCHISSATGEKIYHLPFDQLYDRTKLDKVGEFYALTVAEAEQRGFRRAWRWRGT